MAAWTVLRKRLLGKEWFEVTGDPLQVSPTLATGAAQDRTTAASPTSTRLSDGSAFYKATTPSDTQPVSGPLTDAQLRAAAVPVSGTFYQATQPVSGTFWQATQPISGTVTVQDGGNVISVDDAAGSLTVDGSVSVSNFPASQPVTGTFWQATQPVSGPVTDAQLRASPVPVSGPFFQATQPVSGTVAATQSGAWSASNTDFVTPGATSAAQPGPLMMAVSGDAPPSYVDNSVNPLTLTAEGRLRVSAYPADAGAAWRMEDPYQQPSAWGRSTVGVGLYV